MRGRWALYVAGLLALGALAAAPVNLGQPGADYARVGGPDWASRLKMGSTSETYEVQYDDSGDPALIGWNTLTVLTASTAVRCCWSMDWRVALAEASYALTDTDVTVDGGLTYRDGGHLYTDAGTLHVDGGLSDGALVDGSFLRPDGGSVAVDGGSVAVDGGFIAGHSGVGACTSLLPGQVQSILPLYPIVSARAGARSGVCTGAAAGLTSAGVLVYPPCRVDADCAAAGASGTCSRGADLLRSGAYLVCRSDQSTGAVLDVRTER